MSLRSLLPFGTRPRDAAGASARPFATLQREIDCVWDGTIEITAELPSLEEKDVKVTLSDDILTIRGEKRQEKKRKDENRHVVERSYGAFSRSIQMPAGVKPEDIKAILSNGLLTVSLPIPAQKDASAKKIEVKAAA